MEILDLRCFALDWDRLFRLLQPLDVTLDGVFGHGLRVLQVFAFGHETGQGWNGDHVPAMLIGFEKRGVFKDAILIFLRAYILNPKL